MQRLSAGGLVAYGLTITFASFDWLMSISPDWYSTIYGVLIIGGQGLSAMAFLIVVVAWLSRRPPLDRIIMPEHFHDAGNLTLAFVMLWAYFAFSQYLIIWAGNLPPEIAWYQHRLQTGWRVVAWRSCCFISPCRSWSCCRAGSSGSRRPLRASPLWILAARLVDLFWLIAPDFHRDGIHISWLDVLLPASLASIGSAAFVWQLAAARFSPCTIRNSMRRSVPSSSEPGKQPGMAADHDVIRAPRSERRQRVERLGFGAGLVVSARRDLGAGLGPVSVFRGAGSARAGIDRCRPTSRPLLPPPRLQTNPRGDLLALREAEDRVLTTLRLGGSERGHRADSDRAGDEAHRRAGVADERRRRSRRDDEAPPDRHRPDGAVDSAEPVASRRPRTDGRRTGAGYKREPGMTASAIPAPLREIGFDQHLGRRLPLDELVRDEDGRVAPLGEYFGARPVVLVFAYYGCPMLCTQVVNGLASALGVLVARTGPGLRGRHHQHRSTRHAAAAAAKKTAYLERYRRPGASAGSHFLTADPPAIDRLTKAAGFRYVWDAQTKQFAHPTGIIVVTPDGRLARYLFGIDYGPRDLRLALVEASPAASGTAVDSLLLYCYHYDPMTGRYGFARHARPARGRRRDGPRTGRVHRRHGPARATAEPAWKRYVMWSGTPLFPEAASTMAPRWTRCTSS